MSALTYHLRNLRAALRSVPRDRETSGILRWVAQRASASPGSPDAMIARHLSVVNDDGLAPFAAISTTMARHQEVTKNPNSEMELGSQAHW